MTNSAKKVKIEGPKLQLNIILLHSIYLNQTETIIVSFHTFNFYINPKKGTIFFFLRNFRFSQICCYVCLIHLNYLCLAALNL